MNELLAYRIAATALPLVLGLLMGVLALHA